MAEENLREQAKALGLKYIGVSKEDMKRNIELAKMENETNEAVEEVKEEKTVDNGVNVAVVKNKGRQEIRKYTKEVHGENFVELANEFAKKHDYDVELLKVDKKNVCPKCGHILN